MLAYFNKRKAEKLHEQAMGLSDEGREDEALALYYKALALDEQRANTHYNIGLIYKYQGVWDKSFDHNMRAQELKPKLEAAIWNLGIAATALGRWKEARDAWIKYGVKMEPGESAPEMDFGLSVVRLFKPDGGGETVWVRRIDPARARIINVPLPDSGYRYHDLVLHDGAPNGSRIVDGQEYNVFDVLDLFSPSDYSTYSVSVLAESEEDVDALDEMAEENGLIVEDWSANYRNLCKACSEGRVDDNHEHDQDLESADWNPERALGIAAQKEDELSRLLERWASGRREVTGVECTLSAERH